MPKVTGRDAVKRHFAQIRADIGDKLLRGAARAAATVVADEARDRSISSEVTASIKVRTKRERDTMMSYVETRGPGAYIAPWLEHGTSEHFISVDDSQRGGMSVGRINRLAKEGEGGKHTLVIGGQPVGKTVLHPGARPHPFFFVSLDVKEGEARAAAQNYINSRVKRSGIVGEPDAGDDPS